MRASENPSFRPPWLVACAAGFALTVWGGTTVANKLAVQSIDAITVGTLRSAGAAVLAGIVALLLRLPVPNSGRDRALLAVSGVSSFALWPMLLSLGIGSTSAIHSGLIIATIPIFTGLISCGLEGASPQRHWWVGSGIALLGTAVLVTARERQSGDISGATSTGDLIVLGGAIICAAGYVAGGKLVPRYGTWSTTFWGLAGSLFVHLPVLVLVAPRTEWQRVTFTSWAALGYLAVFSSLLGYAAWFWALGHGGIARIATWQFVQPIMTLVLAAAILGEMISWQILGATVIILGGTVLAQRAAR